MTDIVEKMARDIAVALNGGEFNDGKWYGEGHRTAWRNAVKPYANEIERLRINLENIQQARVLQGKAITDANNEIERLRRQNDFLANDRDGYVQLLTDENSKLREALEKIVEIRSYRKAEAGELFEIARATLNSKGENK